MKKILTLGDSFAYGDELEDRLNAFPHLIAKQLNMDVVNLGEFASGNYKMIRKLLEQDINQYSLVIITWSGFDRIEITDEFGSWEWWPGSHANSYRIASKNKKFRKTIIDYYNRHYDSTYFYRQYLNYVILAQSYLKLNQIPYVFLDVFKNHNDENRFASSNYDLLKKIDTSRYLGWPNKSMSEWTTGLPVGPRFHFLEEGHEVVSQKILSFIKDNDVI
jgi:hypothetical protein